MFRIGKSLSYAALGAAGLGLAGAALASGNAGEGPLRCEIVAGTAGGMISLAALAESDAALGGTYRFTVESVAGPGGSTIRQGGGFSVAPGAPAELGRVMLGANGIYDARLELAAGGETARCEERAGGAL